MSCQVWVTQYSSLYSCTMVTSFMVQKDLGPMEPLHPCFIVFNIVAQPRALYLFSALASPNLLVWQLLDSQQSFRYNSVIWKTNIEATIRKQNKTKHEVSPKQHLYCKDSKGLQFWSCGIGSLHGEHCVCPGL